jgi:hypothetical protein
MTFIAVMTWFLFCFDPKIPIAELEKNSNWKAAERRFM